MIDEHGMVWVCGAGNSGMILIYGSYSGGNASLYGCFYGIKPWVAFNRIKYASFQVIFSLCGTDFPAWAEQAAFSSTAREFYSRNPRKKMTRRVVPTTLSFGQISLFDAISARESAGEFSWKRVIRPEFVAGALLGLVLGLTVSLNYFSTQANGLAMAAKIGLSAYAPPASTDSSAMPPSPQISPRN